MKLMKFLPFAFFSGIHGFALFAPYAAVVMAVDLTVKKIRRERAIELEPVSTHSPDTDDVEFSPV